MKCSKKPDDGEDRCFKDVVDLHTTKESKAIMPWVLGSDNYYEGSKQEEEGCEPCACKGD